MTIYYRQCRLMSENGQTTVAWIPECWAKKGRIIHSRTSDKELDGYMVMDVSGQRRSEEDAIDRSNDYRHQRQMSDI
jgi:hypothetical protein